MLTSLFLSKAARIERVPTYDIPTLALVALVLAAALGVFGGYIVVASVEKVR